MSKGKIIILFILSACLLSLVLTEGMMNSDLPLVLTTSKLVIQYIVSISLICVFTVWTYKNVKQLTDKKEDKYGR